MALEILVSVSTEVIEEPPGCVIGGDYKDGALVIKLDARKQDPCRQLGLPPGTEIYWVREYTVEVQGLSGLSWPLCYEVTTGEGWYPDEKGTRHYFTPNVKGLNLHRRVEEFSFGCVACVSG